jgi:phosphoadenosine phosphosulfate reductase
MKKRDLFIEELNRQLEGRSAAEILDWVFRRWQPHQVVATSSFQNQSIPFLHLLSRKQPAVAILFLDTGFHFPETLDFRDELSRVLGLNLRNLRPQIFPPPELYRQDTDACCALNKVRPLEQELRGASVWLTGVRRQQTSHRNGMTLVERHHTGVLKVNPVLNWSDQDLLEYIKRHRYLPRHPLGSQGYESIGCRPCTSRGESREGRWQGQEKTECGIHGCPIR